MSCVGKLRVTNAKYSADEAARVARRINVRDYRGPTSDVTVLEAACSQALRPDNNSIVTFSL